MKRDFDALQLQARSALAAKDWRAAEKYISQVTRKDWFDLNVEFRTIELKLADPAIKRNPLVYQETMQRKDELLTQSTDAVEGSNYA
ncbi:hypothetical protein [Acetobacter ascendens]|uniref:hypothetical protein n=1 Tax=Acetobacter ascendens TaxID=481146 RepID=UPI000875CAD4|nr:hypothetical protein [Acetobacter ascendens]AOW50685.1 hypothetical protein A4R89_14475 [Acetobacter ascendens]